MQKTEDKKKGEVSFHFTAQEFTKLKFAVISLAIFSVLSIGGGTYATMSMNSLRSENELYKKQLQLAEQKMASLEEKTQAVEKITNQLESMVNSTNTNIPISTSSQGGQGGGSTVPDKAQDVSAKDHAYATANTANSASSDKKHIATPGELLRLIRKMDEKLDNQIKMVTALRDQLSSQTMGAIGEILNPDADTPDIWPVRGNISSTFGYRRSPGGIGSTYHEGIDIAGDYGLPIEATASGVVTQAGWYDGYGNLVEIKHPNGMVTRYGHNSALLVSVGQQVKQGDVVALMGSTGNSTGPHCHYEVRINGQAVDPTYFLPKE